MDKRVLHSPSPFPLILFFLVHFYFTSTHIQVKRKSSKEIFFVVVVLFIGHKKFSLYFQKGTFLVPVLRKKFKLNSFEMAL